LSLVANQPHAWLYLVALIVAVVGIRWFYRRVPETVSRAMRLLLAVLRGVALALLIVLLMEPVLSLVRSAHERPVIGVLVDRSRSMAIADATTGAVRGDEAVGLLNEIVLPRVGRDAELAAFSFAGDVQPLGTERLSVASPTAFDGEITDIARAFEHLRVDLAGRNLGAVVVATDGATNVGGSPYDAGLALGVPVFTLGVGESDAGTDIAVREATTNRVSYSGESLPIRVRVSSSGYADGEAVVELREGAVLLDSRPIRLSESGEEAEVTFRVTPAEPGIHRYTVTVPPASGERLTSNNTRVAVTNVFKGRIRVLLAAPRPSFDLSFVRRELEGDPNVELDVVVDLSSRALPGAGGRAPQSRGELLAYDLVVLIEPAVGIPLSEEWLTEYVRVRGGGLLLVGLPVARGVGAGVDGAGDGAGPSGVAGISELSPIITSGASGAPTEQRVFLTVSGESSPVTRVVSDRAENANVWRGLPPVWAPRPGASAPAGDAVVLAAAGPVDARVPVVASVRRGAGQVIAIAAEGIWRWELAAGESGLLDRLAANAARWLTARGELERVAVETDRDVYAAGERAVVSAQVYRSDFRPAAGAEVTCIVSRGAEAAPLAELSLEADGEFYRGTLDPLPPGRYVFEASAVLAGEDVGSERGEFTVEEFSLEDSEIRRRATLLTRLGEESGGGYFTPESVEEFPDAVPLEWASRTATRELELWNSPWMLLAFVGLLGVEWALRRSKGLP